MARGGEQTPRLCASPYRALLCGLAKIATIGYQAITKCQALYLYYSQSFQQPCKVDIKYYLLFYEQGN